MSKVLKLDMIMNMGTTKTFKINDPKSNLTRADCEKIAAAMCDSEKNPLLVDGTAPVSLKSSYYEETIRTDITE